MQAEPATPPARSGVGCGRSRLPTPASDIEASPSPTNASCFCGNTIHGDGIYCSISCARSDAFSSLCFKEAASSHSRNPSASSLAFNRVSPPSSHHSYVSSISSHTNSYRDGSISDCPSDSEPIAEWNASHYRRLAREELRREERRAERRRRRAEAAPSSTSFAGGRVPDLIGGHGYHSRNSSVATTSSISTLSSRGTSYMSDGSLSRNASTASSSKRLAPGFGHGHCQGIMEDDDEQEWLDTTAQIHVPPRRAEYRKRSNSRSKAKTKPKLEPAPFGMGKDMRDVLDDILRMEQGFIVEDAEPGESTTMPFVKSFASRVPRTPSPVPACESAKRNSGLDPPPAPMRATHRSNRSQPAELSSPSFPLANVPSHLGHQTSLSESHTQLLMLSASPSAPSASHARRSLTFTPTSAYPAFLAAHQHQQGTANPSPTLTVTPPRRIRRPVNPSPRSPTIHHPAMGQWRFPASASVSGPEAAPASNTATPTRRQYAVTPTKAAIRLTQMDGSTALLWPPPNLQPSLFPQSPAVETPEHGRYGRPRSATFSSSGTERAGARGHRQGASTSVLSPPRSGLRLGVLCGSGNGSNSDEDVDMDVDDDEHEINEGMEGIGRAMSLLPDYIDEHDPSAARW